MGQPAVLSAGWQPSLDEIPKGRKEMLNKGGRCGKARKRQNNQAGRIQ